MTAELYEQFAKTDQIEDAIRKHMEALDYGE